MVPRKLTTSSCVWAPSWAEKFQGVGQNRLSMGARTESPHKKFTYRESGVDENLEPLTDCRLPENSNVLCSRALLRSKRHENALGLTAA